MDRGDVEKLRKDELVALAERQAWLIEEQSRRIAGLQRKLLELEDRFEELERRSMRAAAPFARPETKRKILAEAAGPKGRARWTPSRSPRRHGHRPAHRGSARSVSALRRCLGEGDRPRHRANNHRDPAVRTRDVPPDHPSQLVSPVPAADRLLSSASGLTGEWGRRHASGAADPGDRSVAQQGAGLDDAQDMPGAPPSLGPSPHPGRARAGARSNGQAAGARVPAPARRGEGPGRPPHRRNQLVARPARREPVGADQ